MSLIQNEDLNTLVKELSKKNPNPQLIKDKTDLLGIPYSNDLIILMSEVLIYLSDASNHRAGASVAPQIKDQST